MAESECDRSTKSWVVLLWVLCLVSCDHLYIVGVDPFMAWLVVE
ncbi:hypothetical protein Hanom_Chr01g00017251 [Helianthus anomalus]